MIKEVEESTITRVIIKKASEELINLADIDAIVVGAGPSGLTVARYLANAGLKTAVFEKRLSYGGGIGGGGMLLPRIVVQAPVDDMLKEIGCRFEEVEKGVFVVDPAEMIARLAIGAIDAGAKIILGLTVNDVVYRMGPGGPEITGVVANWSAVQMSGLHVDPIAFKARAVIDCTGHAAEVIVVASRKIPELKISVPGEKSMWAPLGERLVVENTREVSPGLFAAGMAVAAVDQTPRMGPIFGGMLLSGKKVAELVIKKIKALSAAEKAA